MTAEESTPSVIEEAAADWLARCHEGLTEPEQAGLQRWLEADPRHAEAFAGLEEAWQVLTEPRRRGEGEALEQALRNLRSARWRRRLVLAAGGIGLAAALTLGLFFSQRDTASEPVSPSSIAFRPDRQTLPDGSVVDLNAGAEIAVDYTPARRTVRLLHGEALFQVAKNKARPFVVIAGKLQVTAVGTAFSVRHAGGEIGVLVTEGKVSVERTVPAEAPQPVYLTAGERVVVPGESAAALPSPENVATDSVRQALAWRGMRVEFTGTPLSEAVAVFNRRNSVQLQVNDAALRGLQLTGIYWADDPEGFVRLLETGMNVRAERSGRTIGLRLR